jgi:hypothetical protein
MLNDGIRRRTILKRNATESHQTFALETYMRRSLKYLNKMVDKDGLPYFNIFWTTPAEAAHDWPDFGDVMARQLQAAVMARHATGTSSENETIWSKKLQALLSPSDGLLYRLPTNYCSVKLNSPFWLLGAP